MCDKRIKIVDMVIFFARILWTFKAILNASLRCGASDDGAGLTPMPAPPPQYFLKNIGHSLQLSPQSENSGFCRLNPFISYPSIRTILQRKDTSIIPAEMQNFNCQKWRSNKAGFVLKMQLKACIELEAGRGDQTYRLFRAYAGIYCSLVAYS